MKRPKRLKYRTVHTIREAERLVARGWRIIQSSPFTERYLLEWKRKEEDE